MLTFLPQTHYRHSLNLVQCHFVTTEMKLCHGYRNLTGTFTASTRKNGLNWCNTFHLTIFKPKNCRLYWNIFSLCVHVTKSCLHCRLKNVIDSSATIQWKRDLIIQQYEIRAHSSNEMGFWRSSCTLITLQTCSKTTFWTVNIMLYSCFKTAFASVVTISTCIIKQHCLSVDGFPEHCKNYNGGSE